MRPSTTITRKFLRHVARWREALNSNKLKLELCYLEKQFRNHSYRKLDFFFQKNFFMTGKQFTKTLLENSWLKASKTEANSIISWKLIRHKQLVCVRKDARARRTFGQKRLKLSHCVLSESTNTYLPYAQPKAAIGYTSHIYGNNIKLQ